MKILIFIYIYLASFNFHVVISGCTLCGGNPYDYLERTCRHGECICDYYYGYMETDDGICTKTWISYLNSALCLLYTIFAVLFLKVNVRSYQDRIKINV